MKHDVSVARKVHALPFALLDAYARTRTSRRTQVRSHRSAHARTYVRCHADMRKVVREGLRRKLCYAPYLVDKYFHAVKPSTTGTTREPGLTAELLFCGDTFFRHGVR
eukprot:5972244-Pleurochrysis_carterae.AAC.2